MLNELLLTIHGVIDVLAERDHAERNDGRITYNSDQLSSAVGTKVPEKIEVPAYQPTLARDPDYIYRLEYVEPPRTVPLTDALPPPPTAVVEDTYIDETGTEVDRESVVAVFDDADVYTIIEVNNLVLRRVWRFEDAKTAVDAREYLTRENEASYTLISKSPEEAIETAIQSPFLEVDIDS